MEDCLISVWEIKFDLSTAIYDPGGWNWHYLNPIATQ